MVQTRQVVRSTKPPTTTSASEATPSPPTPEPVLTAKELHVWEETISKIYMDNMGHFPIRSHSGNLYLILYYQYELNFILF